jgi:hypothetical protein
MLGGHGKAAAAIGEKGRVEDEQRGQNEAVDIAGANTKESLGLALLSETKCGGLGALTVKSLKNQEILEVRRSFYTARNGQATSAIYPLRSINVAHANFGKSYLLSRFTVL